MALLTLWLSTLSATSQRPELPPHLPEPSSRCGEFTADSIASPTHHGWSITAQSEADGARYAILIPTGDQDLTLPVPLPGERFEACLAIRPTPPRALPGSRHPRVRLALRGLHARAAAEELAILSPAPGARSARLRLALIDALRQRLSAERAGLILAMTLGEKGLMAPHLKEPFAVTGTAHLLAISGLHLGALALLICAALRALLSPLAPRAASRFGLRALAVPLSAVMLLGYILAIGAPISAQRAFGMILLVLLHALIKRRLDPRAALLCTLAALALHDPFVTLEAAFWLSALATGAILLAFGARSIKTDRRLKRPLRDALQTSFAAWLGTASLSLFVFGELPLVGLPLNLVLVPTVALLIFPAIVLGVITLPLAPELSTWTLSLAADALIQCARLCDLAASLPYTTARPGALPLALCVAMSALSLFALSCWSRQRRALAVVLALTAAVALLVHAFVFERERDGLRLDFLPVGQGDATLITFPDGTTWLVDAGGSAMGRDPGASVVIPWLKARGVHQLDAVWLTHADLDHMRGLFAVARRAPPGRFIAALDPSSGELQRLTGALTARGAIHLEVSQFTHTGADQDLHVRVYALHEQNFSRNDRSVVLELEYHGARVILPGDIESEAERALVALLAPDAALLKVPHHGSSTSSGAELLDHLSPQVAVISCGLHNRFGHPRQDVLDRYTERGVRLFRTDHHGLITAQISPKGVLTLRHTAQIP